MAQRDIVVTWPKTLPLEDYVAELRSAERRGDVINFRVAHPPWDAIGGRCFMVHDGAVRGWNRIVEVLHRDEGEVRDVRSGGHWPAGFYVVREPIWFPVVPPIPMRGFQGWRWYCEPATVEGPYRETPSRLLGVRDD